jgi:putative tricarboxylic transport membrane protein
MKLNRVIPAAVMGLALSAAAAWAQDWPSQPINVVVPAAAGGGSDILVRTLQPHLEATLGTNIVVVNVPGSGSVAGSRRVVDADPDGYTVLANHVTLLTAMALGRTDFSHTDYSVAATSVGIPLVVVAPGDSPFNTLDDLMAAARDPGQTVIAGVNIGAINHFTMLMLQSLAGDAEFRYVQTGGGADTSAALLGKQIAVGVLAGSEARPLVESGDVKVLAAMGAERVPYFADVPTAREQGLNAVGANWRGFYAPGKMSDEAYNFWVKSLGTVYDSKEWKSVMAQQGMAPLNLRGDAFQKYVRDSVNEIQTLSREIGIIK